MDVWSTGTLDSLETDQLLNEVLSTPEEKGQDENSDDTPVQDAGIKSYKRRWYILILFSLVGATQAAVWNTFAPISASSERAFGWSDKTVYLQTNWGPITYIISAGFFSWLMDVKGMRWSTLLTMGLVCAGCGFRCITSSSSVTWFMHLGQFLNGFGGPVAMGGPPVLSAAWFPADQRTSATAFAVVTNGLGVSASFIIGPLLVPDPVNCTTGFNDSNVLMSNVSDCLQTDIHRLKHYIMRLMYIEFGWSAGLLLLVLLYFPTKPPMPPSITASIERLDFFQGVKKLFRHKKFWMLSIPYAVSLGVYNCWTSILDVNLAPYHISQEEAGWLGFYATVAGYLAGLFLGIFADIFKKRMKFYLLAFFIPSFVMFLVFTLMYQGFIHFSTALLYSTVILGSMLLVSGSPLFIELCCESTYPIAEGITTGTLTCMNNLAGLIFLLLFLIPDIGKSWMNWCNTACILLAIPILCMFREKYTRLDIDIHVVPDMEVNGDVCS